MEALKIAMDSLLRRNFMHPQDMDLRTMCNLFLGQMRISFYDGESSVPILPTGLGIAGTLPIGEAVVVAAADRQMIHTGVVSFTREGWEFEAGEAFATPGAQYPASLSELFYAVLELTEPLLTVDRGLCLCLDFPLEQLADGDCKLESIPAGFTLHSWQDVPLTGLLRAQMEERGLGGRPILVGSAMAATLLCGIAKERKPGRYLALSWGQGLRSAFVAPKSAVVKLKSGEKTLTVFDAQLGCFTGVPFGNPDLSMDRDSQRPGHDLLEKMVSTRQIGEQFRYIIIKAVEERQLGFMCGREFLSLRKLPLETLLAFLAQPEGEGMIARFCGHDERDKKVALLLGHAAVDRAVELVCAGLLSTPLLVGAGRDGENPPLVSLSGEAFQHPLLYQKLHDRLQTAAAELGLCLRLDQTSEGTLIGGAAALLLNWERSSE